MRAACSRPFLLPLAAMGGVGLAVFLGTAPAQAAGCARLAELTLPGMAMVAANDLRACHFDPAADPDAGLWLRRLQQGDAR